MFDDIKSGIAMDLYYVLDDLAEESKKFPDKKGGLEILVGLAPAKVIEGLSLKNGRSVFNRHERKHGVHPYVGCKNFKDYLVNVAKRGTPVQIDPLTGVVQAEIKKKVLPGPLNASSLGEGIWYYVKDGELNVYQEGKQMN